MSGKSYAELVAQARAGVREVECAELERRRQQSRGRARSLRVLDVREPDELTGGLIPGATVLARGLVEKHVADHIPDHSHEIYVVCQSGNRSVLVADVLQQMGYAQVFSLQGGMDAWTAASLPVERTATAAGWRAHCGAAGQRPTWEQVRAEFPIVDRHVTVMGHGERALCYLDHAASTHAPACVLDRYAAFMASEYANIHRGTHLLSRKATELFDDCYWVVGDFIGAELDHGCVVFTTNTTQAIDLAAHVMAELPGKVLITELEHHSNDLPHRKRGPVLRARVLDDGSLDMDHLAQLLRHNDVKLVAVTGASNVTGWMPDVHAIARLAHEHGALILVDAAQLLAHRRIDVRPPGDPEHLDFVAAAGHKAYAPFGAAFLYGPRTVLDAAPPYLPGGGTASHVTPRSAEYVASPDRHQGGTPNIGGVVALAEALRFLDRVGLDRVREHEIGLTRDAVRRLRDIDGVTLYGPPDPDARLAVVSFNVAGASDLLTAAVLSEERALACRNGRFCAHVYVDRLLALQGGSTPEPGSETGAARASFGLYNCEDDVDRLVEAVRIVRERGWVGRYRVRQDNVAAEFAGRCNDRWMEAEEQAPARAEAPGYVFAQLNERGPCRCYLVADRGSGQAALVDPRRDLVDHYLAEIDARGLHLAWTIETHTQADHLSGSKRLKDLRGCAMAMHSASPAPCVDRPLGDGDRIELGGLSIEVWATPGHTADSICLLLPDRVLTGDTLLIDGSGRTDLGGDARAQFHSLQRFRALPPQFQIWPAHDYSGHSHSTVGEQLERNPRLQLRDEAAFVAAMEALELPLPSHLVEALAANTRCL